MNQKLFLTLCTLVYIGYANANGIVGKIVIVSETRFSKTSFCISGWRNVSLLHSLDQTWFIFTNASIHHSIRENNWSKPIEVEVQFKISPKKFFMIYSNNNVGYIFLSCPTTDDRLEIISSGSVINCNFAESVPVPTTSNIYGGSFSFGAESSFTAWHFGDISATSPDQC